MTLGEIIKCYRVQNDNMTMDEFAARSGLSKGYISMLEKNENPRTKKPIVPSFETIKQVAASMRIDVNDLIAKLDANQPINVNSYDDIIKLFDIKEEHLLNNYRKLNDNGKQKADDYIIDLTANPNYILKTKSDMPPLKFVEPNPKKALDYIPAPTTQSFTAPMLQQEDIEVLEQDYESERAERLKYKEYIAKEPSDVLNRLLSAEMQVKESLENRISEIENEYKTAKENDPKSDAVYKINIRRLIEENKLKSEKIKIEVINEEIFKRSQNNNNNPMITSSPTANYKTLRVAGFGGSDDTIVLTSEKEQMLNELIKSFKEPKDKENSDSVNNLIEAAVREKNKPKLSKEETDKILSEIYYQSKKKE